MYVLKGMFNEGESADVCFTLEKAPPASPREWPRFFCWNMTGYLGAVSFGEVLDLFAKKCGVQNPGREAFLLGDQLGSHKDVKTIEAALLMGVFLFFVSANSSHINQPLDEVPFASYMTWAVGRGEQANFDSMGTGTLVRDLLLGAALTNDWRAFTPANIRGSFRPCAPWPCDPVTINRRCRAAAAKRRLCTPTAASCTGRRPPQQVR